MSTLAVTVNPAYTFAAGELVTIDKLNQLATPVINLIGSISSTTISDGAITTAKLAAAALANSTTGRTKMEDGFLSADASGRGKMADLFVTYAKLAGDATSTGRPPQMGYRSLTVKTNVATPLSKVDVTATDLVLVNASGVPLTFNIALTGIDITASGINGLDTSTEAASTWYYIWVIYNGATIAGLLSQSSTNPSMPAGYTYKALVGAVRNGAPGGTTTDFMAFWQSGNRVWVNEVNIFTAKGGAAAYAQLAGADLTAFAAAVPPIAKVSSGNAGISTGATAHVMVVAGDNNGMGACICSNGSAAMGTGEAGSAYRVPMSTGINLSWKTDGVGNIYRLSVSGFEL